MNWFKCVALSLLLCNVAVAKDEYVKEKCLAGAVAVGNGPPKGFKRHCQRTDGKKHGGASEWYPNGQVKSHLDWEDGEKHGEWKTWWEDGTLRKSCGYERGRLQGMCETWYPNGAKESSVEYQRGLRSGGSRVWFDSGQLRESGEYIDDRLHGVWTEYFPTGEKRYVGMYAEGLRDGTWTTFNMEGVRVEVGNYESDWKGGGWAQFYDNGNAKIAGQYKKDKRIGEWVSYFSDGETVKTRGSYVDDSEDGPWAYFLESGRAHQYVEYVEGEPSVTVRVGKTPGDFQITCSDEFDLSRDDGTWLGWPRTLAQNSERIALADALSDGWVYDFSDDFPAAKEVERANCLAVACRLTGDRALCEEIEAVQNYLTASLGLMSRGSDSGSLDGHPLIQAGELSPPDDAATVPTLAWLAHARPGERVAFGQETGGGTARMANEHLLAKNLIPKEWGDYRKELLEPACSAFSEATLADESVWPEVLSARDLWAVNDEMVRTVLVPPSSNLDKLPGGDVPALNLRASLGDWIRSWPITKGGRGGSVNPEVRDHARLVRSVVVISTCADVLGSTYATKYLKKAYGTYREPTHDGWGFVRLVDQLLERQQESERTISGLWKVHWQWSIDNAQMAKLPDYIVRATQWLGTDWRASAVASIDFSDPEAFCASSSYPEICVRKWQQLEESQRPEKKAKSVEAAKVAVKVNGQGLIRCSGDSIPFDDAFTLTLEDYQLPATCLISSGEHKTVFQVFGSGDITCSVGVSELVCDRSSVP